MQDRSAHLFYMYSYGNHRNTNQLVFIRNHSTCFCEFARLLLNSLVVRTFLFLFIGFLGVSTKKIRKYLKSLFLAFSISKEWQLCWISWPSFIDTDATKQQMLCRRDFNFWWPSFFRKWCHLGVKLWSFVSLFLKF